jgi:hypothetical protein
MQRLEVNRAVRQMVKYINLLGGISLKITVFRNMTPYLLMKT